MKYEEILQGHAGCVLFLWFLWGMLRGVGFPRKLEPVERPPTCEFCGYNLTAIPMEGRCPECGEAVEASLGPNVRSGTVFQEHRGVGRWKAWFACSVEAFSRPSKVGRELRLSHPRSHHRSFFILSYMPLIFAIAISWRISAEGLDEGWRRTLDDPHSLMASVFFGYLGVIAAAALTLLAALVVGFTVSRDAGRNAMAGAMQMATYLGGFLVLWSLYAALSGVGLMALERHGFFAPLERFARLTEVGFAFLAWSLPNIVLLIVYFAILGRGTSAARYASR